MTQRLDAGQGRDVFQGQSLGPVWYEGDRLAEEFRLRRRRFRDDAASPDDPAAHRLQPHHLERRRRVEDDQVGRFAFLDAVLFLASSMASYITGHVLNVNGGFYMG